MLNVIDHALSSLNAPKLRQLTQVRRDSQPVAAKLRRISIGKRAIAVGYHAKDCYEKRVVRKPLCFVLNHHLAEPSFEPERTGDALVQVTTSSDIEMVNVRSVGELCLAIAVEHKLLPRYGELGSVIFEIP